MAGVSSPVFQWYITGNNCVASSTIVSPLHHGKVSSPEYSGERVSKDIARLSDIFPHWLLISNEYVVGSTARRVGLVLPSCHRISNEVNGATSKIDSPGQRI